MAYVLTSFGEIVDKYTILLIKKEKISDEAKLMNVRKELEILEQIVEEIRFLELIGLIEQLKSINLCLWDIEDNIRHKEKCMCFDDEFINLARSVYINNDIRAQIKHKINTLMNSPLCEEKSYKLPEL